MDPCVYLKTLNVSGTSGKFLGNPLETNSWGTKSLIPLSELILCFVLFSCHKVRTSEVLSDTLKPTQ